MRNGKKEIIVCRDINTFQGPVHAIRNVSISINWGITCFVGPNGAGKTTLLKSIIGLLKVTSGNIFFEGKDITNMSTNKIVRLGIGYVPEDRRIYPDLTVEENMMLGRWNQKQNRQEILDRMYSLFPQLKDLTHSFGSNLSGGEQSMLAIARTMVLEPRCLLLDEPLEGLSPAIRKRLTEGIIALKNTGLTTITTASDMSYVPEIADVIYTIERGEIM